MLVAYVIFKREHLFDTHSAGPALHDDILHKFAVLRAGILVIIHASDGFHQRQGKADELTMTAAAAQIVVDLDHGKASPFK